MHHFRFVLLAAAVSANPLHRGLNRPYERNDDTGISQTSTDGPQMNCWTTYTARPDATCGDIAATHNMNLYGDDANEVSDSKRCDDLLREHGICCYDLGATSLVPSQTVTPAPDSNNVRAVQSTITQMSMATYTYTVGSGSSMNVQTITVTQTFTDIVTVYITTTVQPSSGVASTEAPTSPTSITSTMASISSNPSPSPTASTAASTGSGDATSAPILSSSTTASPSMSSPMALSATSTATSTTSSNIISSSCVAVAPPAATQTGIVSGCTQWYVAVSGDYCYTVAEQFSIDVDTFMQWNPAVDPPNCPSMLAGDAYCVSTCGNSPSTASPTVTPTLNTTSTTTYPSSTASSGSNVYHEYLGDGSVSAGWPAMSSWIDYETMFSVNTPQMQASCANWAVADDSDDEIAEMNSAITSIGAESGVDPRVILAVVMQESTGCVRVITTTYSVNNPGLMQSHNGNGTCNNDDVVQDPCPQSEITQMIRDGTQGTWELPDGGDGLVQIYGNQTAAGYSGAQAWYRTVRAYNGGSVADSGNLEDGCCTASYASDIANRLTGWTTAARTFDA